MAVNIEIKARATNMAEQREVARELAGSVGQLLVQTDTFFNTPNGRLKLRELPNGTGELIYYERSDETGPAQSKYFLHPVDDIEQTREMFTAALGVRGIVRKKRRLFQVGQTRIHIDEVRDLGGFIELEVVLRPGQLGADGVRIATELMGKLAIRGDDLVSEAYIDLLEAAG